MQIFTEVKTQNLKVSAKQNDEYGLSPRDTNHAPLWTQGGQPQQWGGTILPHSFRSLDLAPYDFRLFGPLNDEQWGGYISGHDELKHSMYEDL